MRKLIAIAFAAVLALPATAGGRDDLATFYPLNVEFHTRLVACADNHKLMQIWPTLEAELHLLAIGEDRAQLLRHLAEIDVRGMAEQAAEQSHGQTPSV